MIRTLNASNFIRRFVAAELNLCVVVNRGFSVGRVRWMFATVSRLGNGVFWYSLIAAIPLVYGYQAVDVSLKMLVTGLLSLAAYKLIKNLTGRSRPCSVSSAIQLGAAPLDHYSFPSGHTLHAVSFTIIAVYDFPELAWLLVPFTILIAASRVILGLHYPTDVAAGAMVGGTIAFSCLRVF